MAALESLATLARHDVALVSITENIDYSKDQGKLMTIMLAGFAEYFSNTLGTHIKKGIAFATVDFHNPPPGAERRAWRVE